jgi:hypothetical protein
MVWFLAIAKELGSFFLTIFILGAYFGLGFSVAMYSTSCPIFISVGGFSL